MDSPVCTMRNSAGSRIEVYRQFGRIVAPDGEIAMEFAAAHIRQRIDRARWPVALPPNLPANAIAIDRYGDYRAGKHTPIGITNPELIAAIHAMRPANVAHLQCDDNGCGAAATGTTCKRGGVASLGEAIGAGAVAALVKRDSAKWGHYVSIGPGGVVIDPELVLQYRLEDYPRKTWTPLAYFIRP
ncbi:MAG: hypothetical protein IJI54_05890 [Kiritimatiellae bacterium]|nr:hypothetical protein [Kiritimatiellia bacterium]